MKRRLVLLMTCLFCSIGLALAQNKRISGTVVDSNGEPVTGATVLVKGTNVGVSTDVDGKYSISVPQNGKTLVISLIGSKSKEIAVGDNLKVVLEAGERALDEVLVVAYGTSTKGAFTGSAAVVKSDRLEKVQVSNVSNALSGAVAGVQILSANGQPGSAATVRVRGVGSINAGSNPLYIVDGVPMDGDLDPTLPQKSSDALSSINTADIESITVLKDAASTALYGARGANGIIMITTKKGKSGKARITFDAKWGANSREVKNYDVMRDPTEYIETAYTALYNAGYYNVAASKGNAAASNKYANTTLPKKSSGGLGYTVYTVPTGQSLIGLDGKLNPQATLGYSDGTYYYTPDNWETETFKSQLRQEYNLGISGGNDKANYFISLGHLDDNGIVSGSGFKRYSGRFKGDYQIKSWIKAGANVSYTYSDSRYPGEQTATSSSGNAFYIANFIAPVYPLYVRDAATKEIKYNNGRKVYDYGDGQSTKSSRSFMSIANPAGDLVYNKTDYLTDALNTNVYADLTPIKGLKLTAKYGVNLNGTRYNDLGNVYMGQSASYGGTAYQSYDRYIGLNQQYIGNYQVTFQNVHALDVTVGYDGYNYQKTNLYATGQNLYNPESPYISNTIDQKKGGGTKLTYATQGIFSRLNYSYDNKYFGNISYRRDASSRFSSDNRWGNFWAASGAWMVSKEQFLKNYSWVDMLKFKASFGQQGNDDIGNFYAYLDQFTMTGANGVFSDGTLYYKGNPNLTWETSTSYNVGFDFSVLANKLSGSVEYFGRKSSDMLYNKPIPGSMGYTSIPMNIGSMTNSGLEIDLLWNVIANRNIKWDINANATFIKNKINKLHPDLGGKMLDGTRIYEEGKSMYRMYLVDYAGVDPDTGLALYWSKDASGNAIKTSNYSLAQDYRVATKDLLADVYGGFGTSISAFGFDASIQFAYQLGGQIYDSGYARLMHGGTSSNAGTNWHKDILNAWSETNKETDVPRLDSNDSYANSTSTRFLRSSDYVSINNITFGYTLPSAFLQKMQVDKIRLFFAADNVALFSSRKGLDPRQSYTSATTALYTPIRTISGGISLTF